jgi:hypothetical protein
LERLAIEDVGVCTYFTVYWSILWLFSVFGAIWYILWVFGIFFPVWVYCNMKNLATLLFTQATSSANNEELRH